MTRYAPEFLAALKYRYEKTDEPMRALSREFAIGISTLSALVEKHGWQKRSQRTRNRLPTEHLLAEVQDLAASLPPRNVASLYREPFPRIALAEPEEEPLLSPVERLQALLVKEIAAEEAVQADLNAQPRLRAEAERCALTLSVLTDMVPKLQKAREAESKMAGRCTCCENDDMPRDIETFRAELAHRIDAFMRSREGEDFGEGDTATDATGSAATIDTPDAQSA